MSQKRRWLAIFSRVGLLLAGIAGGLVLAEAALQLGSLFAGRAGVDLAWRAEGRPLRLLFLGDSNTYGVFVDPAQAYPRVLESEWNRRAAGSAVEVLNLGFPGTNSTKVRNELPRLLRVLRPDAVLVMIGANDYWTVPEATSDGALERLGDWAWRHSRVYRFLYMAVRVRENARLSVEVTEVRPYFGGQSGVGRFGSTEFRLGYTSDPSPPIGEVRDEALKHNLREIIATARAGDVPVVLVTYASAAELYGRANGIMRQEAQREGAPLVDLAPLFDARCPGGKCAELFADGHPTADGHALIARTLLAELPRHLGLPTGAGQ